MTFPALSFISSLAILLGLADAFAAGGTQAGVQKEVFVAKNVYEAPYGVSIVPWLHTLIENAKQDTERFSANRARNLVVIGDAYHWLGHIYEAHGELERAYGMHYKSYEHYQRSERTGSILLSLQRTRDHAKMHLNELAAIVDLNLPAEHRRFDTQMIDPDKSIADDLRDYRNHLKSLAEKTCESLFIGISPTS